MKKKSLYILIISALAFIIIFTFMKNNNLKQVNADNYKSIIESQIVPEIGQNIYEKGYTFGLEYNIISQEDIKLTIKLPDKEINNNTKKEIHKITKEVIKENNYDYKLFQINITNYTKDFNK